MTKSSAIFAKTIRSLNVAADGRAMTKVLHRIADGSEPVWHRAAWVADGHGIPPRNQHDTRPGHRTE